MDKEKVIKGLEIQLDDLQKYADTNEMLTLTQERAKEIIALLKEQPEIVRCKDCKHATMTSDGKLCKYCAMDTDEVGDPRDVYHDADWFCADGERKEGG